MRGRRHAAVSGSFRALGRGLVEVFVQTVPPLVRAVPSRRWPGPLLSAVASRAHARRVMPECEARRVPRSNGWWRRAADLGRGDSPCDGNVRIGQAQARNFPGLSLRPWLLGSAGAAAGAVRRRARARASPALLRVARAWPGPGGGPRGGRGVARRASRRRLDDASAALRRFGGLRLKGAHPGPTLLATAEASPIGQREKRPTPAARKTNAAAPTPSASRPAIPIRRRANGESYRAESTWMGHFSGAARWRRGRRAAATRPPRSRTQSLRRAATAPAWSPPGARRGFGRGASRFRRARAP